MEQYQLHLKQLFFKLYKSQYQGVHYYICTIIILYLSMSLRLHLNRLYLTTFRSLFTTYLRYKPQSRACMQFIELNTTWINSRNAIKYLTSFKPHVPVYINTYKGGSSAAELTRSLNYPCMWHQSVCDSSSSKGLWGILYKNRNKNNIAHNTRFGIINPICRHQVQLQLVKRYYSIYPYHTTSTTIHNGMQEEEEVLLLPGWNSVYIYFLRIDIRAEHMLHHSVNAHVPAI